MTYFLTYIAVCSIVLAPQNCDKKHATHWVVAPERQDSLAGCFRFGEEYIKTTGLIRPGETYPRIFCQQIAAPE